MRIFFPFSNAISLMGVCLCWSFRIFPHVSDPKSRCKSDMGKSRKQPLLSPVHVGDHSLIWIVKGANWIADLNISHQSKIKSILLTRSSPDRTRFTSELSMFNDDCGPWATGSDNTLVRLGQNPKGPTDRPFVEFNAIGFVLLWSSGGLTLTVWETIWTALAEKGMLSRFTLMIRKRFSILYKSKHLFRRTHFWQGQILAHLHVRCPWVYLHRKPMTPACRRLRFPPALPLIPSSPSPIHQHLRTASIIPF